MSRKLRGRKRLVEQLERAREKDKDADKQLADLARSMLRVCREKDVEPETLLFQLELLDQVALEVLMRKYFSEFMEDEGGMGKKRKKQVHEDLGRLVQVIQEQARRSLKGADRELSRRKGSLPEGPKQPPKPLIDYSPHYIR
ncbi:MAG: hypothetical protein A4E29_00492 [Methanomassiliicoccales archaeon PtaB.Bin134]|jgi:hypothetical protein|nr:MAG: hypothetical protein A4E29_00492 [Methanomassiliicoccales archaeon PtaB.Bin134]